MATPTTARKCWPDCTHCARAAAELEERRNELRDRLDQLDEPTQIRVLRWLAYDNPDVVEEALIHEQVTP